jgi:hypothetical protein
LKKRRKQVDGQMAPAFERQKKVVNFSFSQKKVVKFPWQFPGYATDFKPFIRSIHPARPISRIQSWFSDMCIYRNLRIKRETAFISGFSGTS